MSISLPDRGTTGGALRRQVQESPRPKGMRVEIIRGKIVMSPSPSFKHGGIVRRLARQLEPQIGDARVVQDDYSIASPLDPDSFLVPDLLVVPLAIEEEEGWLLEADVVDLTVEVASPSNAAIDFTEKLEDYAAWNIPVYLLLDPRKGDVFVYSDPVDGHYRTTHEARFGDTVELPDPLAGVRIDTSEFERLTYG